MATTASSVTSTGVLTVVSTTGLMVGQTVQLSGTAFGGLVANTTYYITAVASTTISLSLTRGGAALSILGGGGTMIVTPGPRLGPGTGNIITSGSTTVGNALYGDFNSIQALVAKVLGAPTNDDPRYGYNQLLSSAPVAVGDKVTLSQWVNLRSDMIKARGHQSGSASESNNITLPTATSKVTEAMRLAYYNYAQTLTTYRDSLGLGQSEPVTVSTAVRIDDWNGNLSSTVTLNFGDVASARGFFNAGGQVKISAQITGPFNAGVSSKANTWAEMFSQMGTITMDRTDTFLSVGSTGTTSANGYFDLGVTDTQIFRKAAPSGAYTANEYVINARISGAAVVFTISYNDASTGATDGSGATRPTQTYTDPLTGQVVTAIEDEYIDGELRQIVALQRPSGSYVSNPLPVVSITGSLTSTASYVFGMVASKYTINEGETVEVTLKTQNVPDGTTYPYTVTGVTSDRFSLGFMTGQFTIYNNAGSQSWTVDNNLRTDGQTTMIVSLNNGQANTSIKINDTSRNPVGQALFTAVGPGQPWVCPAGVRNVSVLIVGGGAGGASFAGGGGGGGQVRIHTAATAPLQTYYITVGSGGGAGSSGGISDWGGASAQGGSVGTAGSSTGHGGTHTGGTGGSSYLGGGGGSPSGNSGVTMYAAGGGGGGQGASGSNAPNSYTGGAGGSGVIISWFNNSKSYVGGGGGGGATYQGGGASYGGGTGSSNQSAGGNGQAATGGGGGGGGAYSNQFTGTAQRSATLVGVAGGSGGSGLVWIKWS